VLYLKFWASVVKGSRKSSPASADVNIGYAFFFMFFYVVLR
jgi:hypothetical protein